MIVDTVALVVVGHSLGQPRTHREDRLGAATRLDLGLLIHAQNERGWPADHTSRVDILDLRDQIGVGRELEPALASWLHAVGAPLPDGRVAQFVSANDTGGASNVAAMISESSILFRARARQIQQTGHPTGGDPDHAT